MAELRWILLLAGVVFLAVLTVWEKRRPRQGRGEGFARTEPAYSVHENSISDMEQPTATLAPAQPTHTPAHAASASAPTWEIPSWDTPTRDPDEPRPIRETRAVRMPLEDPVQVQLPHEPVTDDPLLSMSFDQALPSHAIHAQQDMHADAAHDERPDAEPEIPTLAPRECFEVPADHRVEVQDELAAGVPTLQAADDAAHVEQHYAAQDGGFTDDQADQPFEDLMLPAGEPIVDWPPEAQRHILAVRVVGLNPDRMSGRPLRQALSACGFVHGRFGIFHQPGADGRALISAANLSKPGVFDPASMDFHRFRGLGLFAVLPGPLPPAAALDHLLDTAGDLAQRLHARLQDEHGMPLDEERLEAMARIVQDMTQGGLHAEPAA
jgi:FtsZ-interacting cell division protein ZipA